MAPGAHLDAATSERRWSGWRGPMDLVVTGSCQATAVRRGSAVSDQDGSRPGSESGPSGIERAGRFASAMPQPPGRHKISPILGAARESFYGEDSHQAFTYGVNYECLGNINTRAPIPTVIIPLSRSDSYLGLTHAAASNEVPASQRPVVNATRRIIYRLQTPAKCGHDQYATPYRREQCDTRGRTST